MPLGPDSKPIKRMVPPLLLFVLSALLRIWNLNADVYGDEAYYYYLSIFPDKYPLLHRNHPFFMYLLYHPFTWNLTAFRLANVVVGAMVPVILYLVLGTYGLPNVLKVAGAIVAASNALLVQYSQIVFLDMLNVLLLLLGFMFYKRKRWLAAGVVLGLSLLTKEYSALAVLVIIVSSWIRFRSPRITFSCGSGFFFAMCVLFYVFFPMGGVLDFLGEIMHGDPFLGAWNIYLLVGVIPAAIAFLYGLWEESLIVISYTVFIFVWGVQQEWYVILPIPFIVICSILALMFLRDISANDEMKRPEGLHHVPTVNPKAVVVLLIMFLAALSSPTITYEKIEGWHPHDLQDLMQFLSEKYPSGQITLIDCFWAWAYYPFGLQYLVAHNDYSTWGLAQTYYERHIESTGLAIVCEAPSNKTREQLLSLFGNSTVYSNDGFTVIALPNRQTSAIPYEPRLTLEAIDENGNLITTVHIGDRIFFRGQLIDIKTNAPVQEEWVHLYAKIADSISPFPIREWDSQLTDNNGQYDTSWVRYPLSDSGAEWLEVRADGLYSSYKIQLWSGSPIGHSILVYAELWGPGGDTAITTRSNSSIVSIVNMSIQTTASLKMPTPRLASITSLLFDFIVRCNPLFNFIVRCSVSTNTDSATRCSVDSCVPAGFGCMLV